MPLLLGFFLIVAAAVGGTQQRQRLALTAAGARIPGSSAYLPRTSLALTRVEAARLARHPLVALGIAGSVLPLAVEGRPGYPGALLAGIFFPALVAFFLAVHLAVGRHRAAGCDDLARTLPAGMRTRTLGHLGAAGVLAAALGLASIAAVQALLGPGRTLEGWRPESLELVQPLTAMLVVAVLAVAAGSWWPHPAAAGPVLAVLLLPPFGWVLSLYRYAGERVHYETGEPLGLVTTTHLAWHAAFLAGFALLGLGLALWRWDRRRAVLALPTLGAAAMTAGFLQNGG